MREISGLGDNDMLPPKIAASMMCADFLHLEQDVAELENADVESTDRTCCPSE
jgi:glutamate 5-kinase